MYTFIIFYSMTWQVHKKGDFWTWLFFGRFWNFFHHTSKFVTTENWDSTCRHLAKTIAWHLYRNTKITYLHISVRLFSGFRTALFSKGQILIHHVFEDFFRTMISRDFSSNFSIVVVVQFKAVVKLEFWRKSLYQNFIDRTTKLCYDIKYQLIVSILNTVFSWAPAGQWAGRTP